MISFGNLKYMKIVVYIINIPTAIYVGTDDLLSHAALSGLI